MDLLAVSAAIVKQTSEQWFQATIYLVHDTASQIGNLGWYHLGSFMCLHATIWWWGNSASKAWLASLDSPLCDFSFCRRLARMLKVESDVQERK